ncbi:MAG: hypothetical protein ACM3YN_08335 [Parcubacteria group bacterium]
MSATYAVHLWYFDEPHVVEAENTSQAKYRSFKAACDAGYYGGRLGGFRAFLAAIRRVERRS